MISSILGKVGAPNTAVCAAKGGVRLLAKAGACELGPEKIRVNSIHPGLTDTEVGKVFTWFKISAIYSIKYSYG